jgi:tetratricopeptide (TPR) repeat protein
MNRRLIMVILLLVTFAVLGRCVWGEFSLLDDVFTIANNPRLNPPGWETLAHYWDPRNPEYSLYVPVTYTVWAGVAAIARVQSTAPAQWTLNPWMFHAANLFVHSLSVLMVFAVLRRLLRNNLGAMFGALVFAIHPLQVESVAWMSGLKDVLSGFWGLLAIWCYVQFADERDPSPSEDDEEPLSPNARWAFYAMGLFCLILGMLSKPAAMTVPLVACVIDRFILRRSWRDSIVYPGVWQLIVMPIMWIAQLTQPATGVPRAPLWARPLVVLDSITFYVGKLILPFNLAVDYGRIPQRLIDSGIIWWTILVPIALAIVIIVLRKDVREIVASSLIFILAPLPTLGLVTLLFSYMSTVADHYLYLAMLGPALLVGGLIVRFGKPAVWAASTALLVFAYLSFNQAGRWQNDGVLFSHTLSVNPASFLAASNLGTVYYDTAKFDEALIAYEQGVRANPDHFQSRLGYGLSLIRVGRVDEGRDECDMALDIKASLPKEIRGDLLQPLYAISEALMSQGRKEDAIPYMRMAIQAMPDSTQARQLLQELENLAATKPATQP